MKNSEYFENSMQFQMRIFCGIGLLFNSSLASFGHVFKPNPVEKYSLLSLYPDPEVLSSKSEIYSAETIHHLDFLGGRTSWPSDQREPVCALAGAAGASVTVINSVLFHSSAHAIPPGRARESILPDFGNSPIRNKYLLIQSI